MKLAWILLFALAIYHLSGTVDSFRRFRLRRVARAVTKPFRAVSKVVRSTVRRVVRLAGRVARVVSKHVISHALHPVVSVAKLVLKIPAFNKDPKIQSDPASVLQTCPEICLVRCPTYMDWDTPCEWLCTNMCQLFDEEKEELRDPLPFSGGIRVISCKFSAYDKDEDGFLGVHELARPINQWNYASDNLIWFIKHLDTDGDNEISKDEFEAKALFCDDE